MTPDFIRVTTCPNCGEVTAVDTRFEEQECEKCEVCFLDQSEYEAVYERMDKEDRRMETIREDTAEVVQYRPLRPEECNLELWPVAAKI